MPIKKAQKEKGGLIARTMAREESQGGEGVFKTGGGTPRWHARKKKRRGTYRCGEGLKTHIGWARGGGGGGRGGGGQGRTEGWAKNVDQDNSKGATSPCEVHTKRGKKKKGGWRITRMPKNQTRRNGNACLSPRLKSYSPEKTGDERLLDRERILSYKDQGGGMSKRVMRVISGPTKETSFARRKKQINPPKKKKNQNNPNSRHHKKPPPYPRITHTQGLSGAVCAPFLEQTVRPLAIPRDETSSSWRGETDNRKTGEAGGGTGSGDIGVKTSKS